jgi:hypothetical protein
MPGLQNIINKAGSIEVNRRKVVGVQITRNEIPRTSLTPTRQPWQFIIEMPNSLRWYNSRDIIESLDYIDRYTPQQVTFANTCLDWMFAYQGSFSGAEISALTVASFSGTVLRLNNVPVKSGGFVCFKQNDLIQIGANPYPFTVVGPYNPSTQATTLGDVTYSTNTGGDLYITMNRPNFITSVTASGITVGSSCTFNLFCPNMPTYKLIPGGYVGNDTTTTNNALIEFSDSFNLYEWVGGAA